MLGQARKWILRENRIYILPTGSGFILLGAIVVMILTAATYNNNLIFILAFFLFALFIVSMLQTHYNLKGVRLRFVGADDAFEGEPLTLHFRLEQKRARDKGGLTLRPRARKFAVVTAPEVGFRAEDRVIPAALSLTAWGRGVHAVPEIWLETRFPLGVFTAWKVFRPEGKLVIYPKPAGDRTASASSADAGDLAVGANLNPEGDFGELRAYRQGDSHHQIAWKHFARSGQLYNKAHWGAENRHYKLEWPTGMGSDLETGLRQMSRWILDAVTENASFELEMPDFKIESGRGMDHGRACWRALAEVTGSGGPAVRRTA